MNGILGFAELLKTPKLSGEEQQKYIAIIEKSGQRMLNIINDLIEISKLDSGQIEVSFSATNLNEQFEFLWNFFKLEAVHKGVSLSVSCPLKNGEAVVVTDKEKLYAILTNLIKNSLKFTAHGTVEFGYELKNDQFECYVKDTGIGISPKQQKNVFERFVRVDSQLSSGYEGAGLGLAISKSYVEMLGGKIWMESEVGKGTFFYFTLPATKKQGPETTTLTDTEMNETKTTPVAKKATVLLTEDDEASMQYLTIIVNNMGFRAIEAKTGEEAVELCRDNQDISLVLMDIKMPVMDGLKATKLIKALRPGLPVVAQTAFALENEKVKYSLIFDDYLTKPIRSAELMRVINLYLKDEASS
jgi:hypothetical protein